MRSSDRLDGLIERGEALVPKGGDYPTSYNEELQADYFHWREQCIEAIQELGEDTRHLLDELESDKRGSRFYKTSASRVLGVTRAARGIVKWQGESSGL